MLHEFFVDSKLSVISERYELQEEVGLGKSSTCFFGVDRETGREILIKLLIFPRSRLEVARFRNEAEFLKNNSPLNGIIRKIPEYIDHGVLHGGRIMFLVMERVRGELLSKWIEESLDEASLDERLLVAYRVFGAVEHQMLFTVHRDLHPGNIILLDEGVDLYSERPDYKAIVLDWGQSYCYTAYAYSESDDDDMVIIHHGIGREITTSFYSLPPEIFKSWDRVSGEYNKFDSWAMGLLLYKLLTGKDLFDFRSIGDYSESLSGLGGRVRSARFEIIKNVGSEWEILAEIFFRLMRVEPSERMFIQDARHAIWFVIVEGFRPTDYVEMDKFLKSPDNYKGVTWKYFKTEDFDYS